MRYAGFCLLFLLLSACAMQPSAKHPLIIRYDRDGAIDVRGAHLPPMETLAEADLPPSESVRKRISITAIEAYLRSQMGWFGSKADVSFAITDVSTVKLEGVYHQLTRVTMTQQGKGKVGICNQDLFVLATRDGLPVKVFATGLISCLV